LGNLGKLVAEWLAYWRRARKFNNLNRGQYGQGSGQFINNQNKGGRGGERDQYQGRAYVQKIVTTSSGGVSTGHNRVNDERTTVSATTVAASSRTAQQFQVGSSYKTDITGKRAVQNDNHLCNKCGKREIFQRTVLRKYNVSIMGKDINP
jgi:hypothetical protein